jgi:hypothetical protein
MEGPAMKLDRFLKNASASDWFRRVTVGIAMFLGPCTVARAESAPVLVFDAPFAASCRRIALPDAAKKYPDQQLIEVKIPITARLLSGAEKDIKECVYTLVDPGEPATLSALDWLPRTELKTAFAKPIQHNEERTAKVGINMSAQYILTATGESMGELKSGVAYELLPPQEIVLASGTTRQGHGVYFKLKPSTQTTLEGMKLFSAICAVPRGWRGGCLKLQCEAVGLEHGVVSVFNREVQSGLAVYCVALHEEGDREAERVADHVATCQQQLFDSLTGDAGADVTSKAASWRDRIFSAPRGWNKPSRSGSASTAATEAELLNYVLDRTAAASPKQEFPRAVMVKLRDLQDAVEALRIMSTGKRWAAKLTGPTSAGAVTIGLLEESEELANRAQSKPLAGLSASVAKGRVKSDPTAVQVASAKNLSGSDAPSNGQPVPPAATASAPQAVGGAQRSTEANGAAAPCPDKPVTPDQVPQDSTRRIWYFVASMWGAVFTYVLAPLVVDVLRRRLKGRSLRRSKPVETSLPAAERGPIILAVPEAVRHARQAQLLHRASKGSE